MNAYICITILGLGMTAAGIVGTLYTTRIVKREVRTETHITYFDKQKGWIRTWVDNSPDVQEFWETHMVVERNGQDEKEKTVQ